MIIEIKELQKHLSFTMDESKLALLPATAEILYGTFRIGQIRKACFGVCFFPYPENIQELEINLLMKLNEL